MVKFTLYTANCRGEKGNCFYPNRVVISDKESLIAAASKDHVTAKYKENYRSNDNFLCSDCIPLDCDNDFSEKEEDWITPFDLALQIPGVAFAVVYSKSHMKTKGNKSERPRFHVFFPISEVTDSKVYTELKKQIAFSFPYFDANALDSARFLYGTENSQVEIYEGDKSILDYINEIDFAEFDRSLEEIHEGNRNSTMSHIAGKIIKRYGACDEAHDIFLQKAELCNPPLSDEELDLIWKSAIKFGNKVSNQDGYISPEEYNKGLSLKPDDYSDIGQAKVLSSEYNGVLVFTDSTDYMCYDGTHWAESKQMAVGVCEEFLDKQLDEAMIAIEKARNKLLNLGIDKGTLDSGGKTLEKAVNKDNEGAFKEFITASKYYAFVMKRRDMKYVISALQAAKPMLLKKITDFDNNEYLLNTPIATYDLRDGSSTEHKAEDLITKVTNVSPGEDGMELWLKAINSFFCNNTELIEYVQQIVGLSVVGKVYVEALIIAYGEGSNGKSTFWNTIARVLGSYSGTISADALTVGCKRNVKPEMAELKGKRLVIAAELEEGMRLNTSVVKQLCSTDEITAEKKYKDPFKYIPTHTLILYTNHLPKVGANDEGIWRRLIVIPFNAKISGKSDIKNYSDYLFENAGGAILSWIIEGAMKAIKNDYKQKIPKIVQAAINKYRENNDWFSAFIEDCCETDVSYMQKSGELYQEYRSYCLRTGEYARSTTDFYAALENAGFERKRTKSGIMVGGLRLKTDFLDQ